MNMYYKILCFSILLSLLNPALGAEAIYHNLYGRLLGYRTAGALFALYLLGTFGVAIGLSAALCAAILGVHTFLVRTLGMNFILTGIAELSFLFDLIGSKQSKIAKNILLACGLVMLYVPMGLLGWVACIGMTIVGMNTLVMPFIARKTFIFVNALELASLGVMCFSTSLFAIVAAACAMYFLILGSMIHRFVYQADYTALLWEHNKRLLIEKAKKVVHSEKLQEIVAFLKKPGLFSFSKEAVFDELVRLKKDVLLLQVLQSDAVDSDLCVQLISKLWMLGKIEVAKELLQTFKWVNGDGFAVLQKLIFGFGCDVGVLHEKLGLGPLGEHIPYNSPVADMMKIFNLRKKMSGNLSVSTNADNKKMMDRARLRIKQNNEDVDLTRLFVAKGGLVGVEKEIKDRLLTAMYRGLEADVRAGKPNAQKIRDCIDNKRPALVNGLESALKELRSLIADNNEDAAMVAWRMWDPKAACGGFFPSYLISSDPMARTYPFMDVVDRSLTDGEVVAIARHANAYCYLFAVREDAENKDEDMFLRYMGMLYSAGRSNNNGSISGIDHHTCFPGFTTHMGEYLGGDFVRVLQRIVANKIQVAFQKYLEDPSKTVDQKTELYDALMLLDKKDALTLLKRDCYLTSDVLFEKKITEAQVKRLMQIRKNFVNAVFDDNPTLLGKVTSAVSDFFFGESKRIENRLQGEVLEKRVSLDGVDNFSDYVNYHLLLLDADPEQMSALYSHHVLNGGVAVAPKVISDNPFVCVAWGGI